MTDKTDREIMQQALDAIMDAMMVSGGISDKSFEVVKALRERLAQPDPLQRFTDVQQEIEAALAQPEQEPVACVVIRQGLPTLVQEKHIKSTDQRLYTGPLKREWKALTKDEMKKLADTHLVYQPEEDYFAAINSYEMSGVFDLIRALEAKLKEKND